jgi:type VI secretion system protein ImpM
MGKITMPSATKDFATGYYGKLPARGDFITRGMSPAFTTPWDAWLQSALSASRESLGADWLQAYLSAPLWRFLLPAGLLAREAVIGVLCPSVDRIGRHFPFTIASVLGRERLDPIATMARADSWYEIVEETILDGLDPALDMEAFGIRVDGLAFPAGAAVSVPGTEKGPAPGMRDIHLHLALEQGPIAESALRPLRSAVSETFALWVTAGSEVIPLCALATIALPAPERFAALLDGRWSGHGWRECAAAGSGMLWQPGA